jgi:hypothetical protein
LSAEAHYHGLIDYNKTDFAPPGCKIIAHEKPAKRRTWAPHGQHGYSLGPEINHYRCQNVYISATASKRTVDTLEFFPHNSPMPQLSSTERLIMAANDTTNSFKNPHPEVPFTKMGGDTIEALTKLAEIFKNKFQKVKPPVLSISPIKAAENKRPAVLIQPILTSAMQHTYQTRSQSTIDTGAATNTPLLLRLVTPMTGQAASPRVPTRSQNLPPGIFHKMISGTWQHQTWPLPWEKNHWYQQHLANAVVHPVTDKQMEYMDLTNDPGLQPLWKWGFGNEAGRLFQGIRDIPGTNTCFFVELTNIPKDINITYGKIVCD